MSTRLERTAFTTDRALEFFSEPELRMQLGYSREAWPLVLVKELIDNGLDACEAADIQPQITVTLEADAFEVADNGPGLPAEVIKKSLNYHVRVSDKRFYISPSRGQLGNALKALWATPFVATSKGHVEVIARGVHHDIQIDLDRISQKPRISHQTTRLGRLSKCLVQNGTSAKTHWRGAAGSLVTAETFDLYKQPFAFSLRALVANFAAFNPHASFTLKIPKERPEKFYASVDAKWRKWRPDLPTSPHWYTSERLCDLISAYLTEERNGAQPRTIRAFVSEFSGLARTQYQKEVCKAAGLSGRPLSYLVKAGDLRTGAITQLLRAMKKVSRPIKPRQLGVIDKEHLFATLESLGASPKSLRYSRKFGMNKHDLPFVIEVAFGVSDSSLERRMLLGLNHSPVLKVFSDELSDILNDCRIQRHDPVILLVHQVCPRFDFAGHGKGSITADE